MKTKEISILLISVGMLGLVAGAYWFAYSSFLRLESDNVQLASTVTATRTASMRAVRARDERTTLIADETVIEQHVVRTDNVVTFLHFVETSGDAYGTVVEVLSVSDVSDTANVALAVQVQGSFAGVMHTLGALEYGTYALQVKTITLALQQDGTWKLSGSFTVPAHTL